MLKSGPTTDFIRPFLLAARNGDRLDPGVFVEFCQQYDNIVIWGAGNLGTALGKKLLQLGIKPACYWDAQAEKIGSRNGLAVVAPFSGNFDRDATLVLFCIGNVAVGPNIQRQLGENGWRHVVHGNDLLQALLCPLANDKPAVAKICNSFDICSVCSCERLHNIVRADAARKQALPPDKTLSFDRVHFITNNVCNLKCTHCFLYINTYTKERKQNVDTAQILQDIEVVMRAVHSFGVVNIFGGEPFLHRDIGRIIDGVLSHDNFGAVIVNTNGVEPIKPTQMESLKDTRIRLAFSNYLEVLDEKRTAAFHRNIEMALAAGVNAKYQNSLPTWNVSSTLEDKHDTEATKRQKKHSCGVRYLYVFDGKLFPCSVTLSIQDLGVADYPSDYVELDPAKSPEEIRNGIRRLLEQPYYDACGHCESFGSPALTGSAAEQGFVERYALPDDGRRRKVRIPVVSATEVSKLES
jgi:organic radical activating enzyme